MNNRLLGIIVAAIVVAALAWYLVPLSTSTPPPAPAATDKAKQ